MVHDGVEMSMDWSDAVIAAASVLPQSRSDPRIILGTINKHHAYADSLDSFLAGIFSEVWARIGSF